MLVQRKFQIQWNDEFRNAWQGTQVPDGPPQFHFFEIIGLHHMRAFFVPEAPGDHEFRGVLWKLSLAAVRARRLPGNSGFGLST